LIAEQEAQSQIERSIEKSAKGIEAEESGEADTEYARQCGHQQAQARKKFCDSYRGHAVLGEQPLGSFERGTVTQRESANKSQKTVAASTTHAKPQQIRQQTSDQGDRKSRHRIYNAVGCECTGSYEKRRRGKRQPDLLGEHSDEENRTGVARQKLTCLTHARCSYREKASAENSA